MAVWMCLEQPSFSSQVLGLFFLIILVAIHGTWFENYEFSEWTRLKCHVQFWLEKTGKLSHIHCSSAINH